MTVAVSQTAEPASHNGARAAKVTLTTATALAIADMIGVGVFTSLGFQLQGFTSPFALIMLWVVGGVVALCGALCYAELAAAFPKSGGEYNFLSRLFHPMAGFMAGWISATVGFAAPVALAAMACGEYAARLAPGTSQLFAALAVVWAVTLVQLRGIHESSTLQNVATGLKVLLIAGLIVAGLMFGTPQPVSFAPQSSDWHILASVPFATSLVFVLYAYSGWNAATYIASDIDDPSRTLPRALLIATLLVMALYIGLNAVFLYTTPIEKMTGQINVAAVAAEHIFGPTGGKAVGALIAFGLISAISAMMWIGPRVTATMGQDFPALSVFARSSGRGVPYVAIGFQLLIVHLLLFTRSFEAVLDYIQFSLTLCSFMTVLGMMVLRWREPDLHRPYRTWGYPVTPLIMLSATGYVLFHLATERPVQSFAGLLTILAGLAVYAAVQNPQSSPSSLERRPANA